MRVTGQFSVPIMRVTGQCCIQIMRATGHCCVQIIRVTGWCSVQIQVGNLYFNSSKIGYITYIRSPDSSGLSVAIIALIVVLILVIFAFIVLLVIMKRQKVYTSWHVCPCLSMHVCLIE